MKEYHLHGSFCILKAVDNRYLFLQREDNGLLELPGGGFNSRETDHAGVVIREVKEEARIILTRDMLKVCAVLGQRLKKEIIEYYGGKTEVGFVFVHTVELNELSKDISVALSNEHTHYEWFLEEEIIAQYTRFSSGPLWMWFSFLAFQRTGHTQYGKLYDRRIWEGVEYSFL